LSRRPKRCCRMARRQASDRQVHLKSAQEMASMREAGRVVAVVLRQLQAAVRPGVKTKELDELAETTIMQMKAEPAFKGYGGYPATLCASINDEVVHGIPGERELEEGDIVGLDVGAIVEGFYSDGAVTVAVGSVSARARRLMKVTREALDLGIAQARAGKTVGDIAGAIERHVEKHGYSVVRELSGHGIGRNMHEAPQVPNFTAGAPAGQMRLRLEPGMTVAIEPMVNEGGAEVVRSSDGWTYRTRDGGLSAHYEHSVAVTENGAEVLTRA
jgi:methionyl aminopeptidase